MSENTSAQIAAAIFILAWGIFIGAVLEHWIAT